MLGSPVGKLGTGALPLPLVGSPAGAPVGKPGILGNRVGMEPPDGSPGLLGGKALGKLGMPGATLSLLGRPVGKPGIPGKKVGKALGRAVGKLGAAAVPLPPVGSP